MGRVGRDVGDIQRFRALVPENELRLAGVFEVAKNLVMVLRLAAFFDQMPLPGQFRVEIRIRILPPPDLVALVVATENDVGVAIPIDVAGRTAGLDGEELRLDHVTVPPRGGASIPDQRGPLDSEGDNEILHAILVEIGDEIAGLLR